MFDSAKIGKNERKGTKVAVFFEYLARNKRENDRIGCQFLIFSS